MEERLIPEETTSDLQAALDQKQVECDGLRAQLHAALQEAAEYKAKFRGLEERCEGLKHDIKRLSEDGPLRAHPQVHHVAESSAPASECSDMTEDDLHPSHPSLAAVTSCPEVPILPGVAAMPQPSSTSMSRSKSAMELDKVEPKAGLPPTHVRQSSYSPSLDFSLASAGPSSNLTSPRTTEMEFSEAERHRMKDDSSRRVREVHRRFGDRNMAGFLRDFGYKVEGGWNPTEQMFDKQKKTGLIMSHPDKQLSKPYREQCLAEAVFKELNEWEYTPPIDRPHFGFGSIAPSTTSSPPTTTGYVKHNRTPSYGVMQGSAYQNPRSAMEIASRLSRRSADPSRQRMYNHH
eukprot:jgi/Tetstr1/423505/TSEL_014181.t1